MKKMLGVLGVVGVFAMMGLSAAEARTVRATELTPQVWSQFDKGEISDLTVEFRQGDEIPVTLQTEGDLLETKSASPTYIGVKRSFWVRMEQNQILMSLDGTHFKPFNQVIGGSFTVGASSDQIGGPASAINMLFKGYLK
ncbi:MAG: hypothetical protein ACK5QT_09860 [Oligoflexia bacterium]